MSGRAAGIAVLVVAAVLGCGRDTIYTGVGDVLAIDEAQRQVTIRHEDIPGLMGAMTMRFALASPAVLTGIGAGMRVRFTVRQDGDAFVIASMASVAADPTR